MSPTPDRPEPPGVTMHCEACRKEIPVSEAVTAEGEEYVLYFCGIECFDLWRKDAEREYGKD
jgi:hypothetical protein